MRARVGMRVQSRPRELGPMSDWSKIGRKIVCLLARGESCPREEIVRFVDWTLVGGQMILRGGTFDLCARLVVLRASSEMINL